MKKYIYLIISLLLLPIIVKAETLTYEICKSGCEYSDLEALVSVISSASHGEDTIIINFKDSEVYEKEGDQTVLIFGTSKYLIINGNGATITNYKITARAKNKLEFNDLNFGNFVDNDSIHNTNYSDYYMPDFHTSINFSLILRGDLEFNNCTIHSISISGLVGLSSLPFPSVKVSNSKINYFKCMGTYEIENSDIYYFAPMHKENYGGTIKNSKLGIIVNGKYDEGDAYLNIYNSTFREFNYYNANHILEEGMSFANEKQYGIIDNANNDTYSTAGNVITTIYFDKETKLKPSEKLNLVEYLDYYTEDKEIEYTIEDESIAKIENKELTALKEGSTKVTVTTDEGHVVYRINLTVKSANAGKINKINPPIKNFASSDFSAENLDNIIPLTNEEQSAKEQGTNINVFLEVKDVSDSVTTEEKAKINEKISNKETLAMYLDVSLFKQIEGQEATKIEETNGNIKVSLKVPENLKNNNPSKIRKYYILRLHNGVVDKLETELNGDILSFETDKFSTYALTYEDVDNPKTGDSILTYVILSIISLIGLIIYKKAGKKS